MCWYTKGLYMQTLPLEFGDRIFRYTQLRRQSRWALYRQTHVASGITRYEVVRLHIALAHTWPNGKTTPEHEAYPAATAWGREGWTFHTRVAAEASLATQTREKRWGS